jgi:hypothetical protein
LAKARPYRAGATLVGGEMLAFEWAASCSDRLFTALHERVKRRPLDGGH